MYWLYDHVLNHVCKILPAHRRVEFLTAKRWGYLVYQEAPECMRSSVKPPSAWKEGAAERRRWSGHLWTLDPRPHTSQSASKISETCLHKYDPVGTLELRNEWRSNMSKLDILYMLNIADPCTCQKHVHSKALRNGRPCTSGLCGHSNQPMSRFHWATFTADASQLCNRSPPFQETKVAPMMQPLGMGATAPLRLPPVLWRATHFHDLKLHSNSARPYEPYDIWRVKSALGWLNKRLFGGQLELRTNKRSSDGLTLATWQVKTSWDFAAKSSRHSTATVAVAFEPSWVNWCWRRSKAHGVKSVCCSWEGSLHQDLESWSCFCFRSILVYLVTPRALVPFCEISAMAQWHEMVSACISHITQSPRPNPIHVMPMLCQCYANVMLLFEERLPALQATCTSDHWVSEEVVCR